MSKSWRNKSITIILVLFSVCVLLFAFTFVNSAPYTGQSIAETYNLSVGQSVFNGDSILGQNRTIELPFLSNVGFIGHQLLAFDLHGILMSLSTGVVPFDFATVSSEGIDSYGRATGIEGPGYLTFEGDKLAVKGPDTYVWGYSAPSKVLTKTSNGVDVVDQVQGNLRRTEIVVMAVVELPATLSTWILAVFQVVITHGNLGLHTEMTAHRPLVAITEATTHIPAFIAVVVEAWGDAERKVHVSGVELTAHQVEGDERTIHALAEVTAQLRLQQPMTDLLITIEIPWIQTKTDVGGPMA